MKTPDLIRCHFGRIYRYESIKSLKHLDLIIKEALKLIESSKKELLHRGIDIESEMKTPKFAALYLEFCAEQQHDTAINKRCDKCDNFGWFPNENEHDLTEFRCTLFDIRPMHCNNVIESEDFSIRLQKAMNQCSECPDAKSRLDNDLDLDETYCPHNYNAFKCLKHC